MPARKACSCTSAPASRSLLQSCQSCEHAHQRFIARPQLEGLRPPTQIENPWEKNPRSIQLRWVSSQHCFMPIGRRLPA